MANRTYAPELAARLAMADSDARAAVDAQANGEGPADEPADSDEDSLQSPGRANLTLFTQHIRDATPDQDPSFDLDDRMDIDSLAVSPSNMSEASTVRGEDTYPTRADRRRTRSIQIANSPPPPYPFSSAVSYLPGQSSDRENSSPDSSEFYDGNGNGPFYVTPRNIIVYQDDAKNPDHPVKPYLPFPTPANDPTLSHLREISGLASWTVSSYKPSCGVAALLSPSTRDFWQSDGPQPHLLNIHFFKLVRIVKLRIYLDFELDESYTPTRLSFAAGTHEYDAVEFAEWRWDGVGPKGWVDVDLSQCGSDEEREKQLLDGQSVVQWANAKLTRFPEVWSEESSIAGVLRCFFLQVRVLENHQNGKDTHIRGVQIFARDERVKKVTRRTDEIEDDERIEEIRQGLEEADWMGEPELR